MVPFKKNMIQGGAIVLAALVLGLCMVWTVKTFKSYDNTVKVRGLCEKEVPADRAVAEIQLAAGRDHLAGGLEVFRDSVYEAQIRRAHLLCEFRAAVVEGLVRNMAVRIV